MTKPSILFFARSYQAEFFPALTSDRYEALFVTMTREEAAIVEQRGGKVVGCFERDFASLTAAPVPENYLLTSFMADRFLGRFNSETRRTILGKEITFWATLLDTYRPAAVVNELVAIEISEVMLIESRKRSIPYLAPMTCPADDLFYWLPDPMTTSGSLLPHVAPGDAARAVARDYMVALSQRDYKPAYVQNLAGRRALRPLAAALVKWAKWTGVALIDRFSGNFRYEIYTDEYGKRLSVYFKAFWRRYDSLDDIPAAREIIFYPVHQEPEATLHYMSQFCANQAATIENILKCLTPEQVLVVKEHPADKGALLRRKFWELRNQYSALYYIPAEVNGRAVLARATRVVTLTSTLAWEAASIGRSVYVLGEVFFDSLRGMNAVRDFKALRIALRKPDAESPRVEIGDIEDFVGSIAEISYPGNVLPHDQLYSASNLAGIVAAICDGAGLNGPAANVADRVAAPQVTLPG